MIPAAGAGVLTVIVPVATVHVGCVGVAVGAAGADGAALIVTWWQMRYSLLHSSRLHYMFPVLHL